MQPGATCTSGLCLDLIATDENYHIACQHWSGNSSHHILFYSLMHFLSHITLYLKFPCDVRVNPNNVITHNT